MKNTKIDMLIVVITISFVSFASSQDDVPADVASATAGNFSKCQPQWEGIFQECTYFSAPLVNVIAQCAPESPGVELPCFLLNMGIGLDRKEGDCVVIQSASDIIDLLSKVKKSVDADGLPEARKILPAAQAVMKIKSGGTDQLNKEEFDNTKACMEAEVQKARDLGLNEETICNAHFHFTECLFLTLAPRVFACWKDKCDKVTA